MIPVRRSRRGPPANFSSLWKGQELNVRNKHAYPVPRGNYTRGIGERANTARNPTHIPIPHLAVVEGLVETLSRRQIGVVGEEYAVSKDGMEASMDADSRLESGMRITSAFGCRARSARVCSCVTISPFRGTIVPSSRNTRRTFRSKTACPSALVECNAISNRCSARWSTPVFARRS